MKAAVGKSGPWMCFMSPSTVISGLRMRATVPSTISPRLWGGMLVATPTAIPEVPLSSSIGSREGITTGSSMEPS